MSAPNRALIVVDVQGEYFAGPLEIQHPPREEALAAALRALDAARAHDLPVVVVQHRTPEGTPVFADGSPGWSLHADLEAGLATDDDRVQKAYGSVFADTGLADRLRERGVDTVTLVGFMTNNCIVASAADAEPLGLAVEVLSDATGAIALANEAGQVSAEELHRTLMVLLQSNFAAVTTTDAWTEALAAGAPIEGSDLVTSALAGRDAR